MVHPSPYIKRAPGEEENTQVPRVLLHLAAVVLLQLAVGHLHLSLSRVASRRAV
jgi:hypothetical protein